MHKICGVIDFGGLQDPDRFLVPEFGFISMDWNRGQSFRYDLSPYEDEYSDDDSGPDLMFHPMEEEVVYPLEDLDEDILSFYNDCKTRERRVVAYKGGQVEQRQLEKLGIPGVDLEDFGCPRFDELKPGKYIRFSCGYPHYDKHCPISEVTAFKNWVCEIM